MAKPPSLKIAHGSRIKRLSSLLLIISTVAFIVVPLGFGAAIWNLFVIGLPVPIGETGGVRSTTTFSFYGILFVVLNLLFNLVMSVAVIYRLRTLAKLFHAALFFVIASIHHFKALANTVMVWVMISFVFSVAEAFVLNATGDIPMMRGSWLSLTSFDWVTFAACFLFRIFAEIIEEGLKQKAEIEYTI